MDGSSPRVFSNGQKLPKRRSQSPRCCWDAGPGETRASCGNPCVPTGWTSTAARSWQEPPGTAPWRRCWGQSWNGDSSPGCLRAGSKQNHLHFPRCTEPAASVPPAFWHLSGSPVGQAGRASVRLSVCPSREWVKQPMPHPTRPAWASRHGRERLTAGAHYGAAIKRVEALPPTLIRGASQLHALEPRDEVQGLFTTSCETGECPWGFVHAEEKARNQTEMCSCASPKRGDHLMATCTALVGFFGSGGPELKLKSS